MRIERHKLIFMGLVALHEIQEHCIHQPWHRAFTLRVTLAMLYAFSDGEREPFDDFWRACAEPNDVGQGETIGRTMRSSAVTIAFNRICRALGVVQTINFGTDLSSARSDMGEHGRAYDTKLRGTQSPEDAARQRFAEMLRVTARETAEEAERKRLARTCPLRG